jgi:hypothetical protein
MLMLRYGMVGNGRLINDHRVELGISEYSVSEATLEQIFIRFARQQEEEVASPDNDNNDHDTAATATVIASAAAAAHPTSIALVATTRATATTTIINDPTRFPTPAVSSDDDDKKSSSLVIDMRATTTPIPIQQLTISSGPNIGNGAGAGAHVTAVSGHNTPKSRGGHTNVVSTTTMPTANTTYLNDINETDDKGDGPITYNEVSSITRTRVRSHDTVVSHVTISNLNNHNVSSTTVTTSATASTAAVSSPLLVSSSSPLTELTLIPATIAPMINDVSADTVSTIISDPITGTHDNI